MPTRPAPWSLEMGIAYRLAAFDRRTEELIGSDAIPSELLPEIKKIARIPPSDDGAGDYPLNSAQVSKIAKRLGIKADPMSVDYFIEPFVQETGAALKTAGC
jgi:hypothetical protein